MQKYMESRILRLLLIALASGIGFSGCGSDSDDNISTSITNIVEGFSSSKLSGQGEDEVDVDLHRPATSPTGVVLTTVQKLTLPPSEIVASTRTDANGFYRFTDVPVDDTYFLTYTKEGFIDEAYFEVTVEPESFVVLEPVPLLDESVFDTSAGIISGTVIDAATGSLLDQVSVRARAGINNRAGTVLLEDPSDNGFYSLAFLDAGNYTLEATLSGYQTAYFDALVLNADDNPDTADETVVGILALVPDNLANVSFPVSGNVFAAYTAVPGSVPGPPFPLSGAAVRFREGSNTTVGAFTNESFTDTSGFYSISSLLAGQYTIEGALSGFNFGYVNLALGSEAINQNVTLLPFVDNAQQITIVLTWGNTANLDGQLTQVVPEVNLIPSLNDDTDGFGPETTLIVADDPDKRFEYFVKDPFLKPPGIFTAQVRVYRGNNLIFTFEPPLDDEDLGLAKDWHVFSIDGDGIIRVNDLVVGPNLIIGDDAAFEGDDNRFPGDEVNQPLDFSVSLSSVSNTDIVLEMATADGTANANIDYQASNFLYSTNGGDTWIGATGPNGTIVTIPAGSTSILVRVFSIHDSTIEPNETFTLGVSRVIFGVVNDFSSTGTGTILNDDFLL
jgi:hypothetical protein